MIRKLKWILSLICGVENNSIFDKSMHHDIHSFLTKLLPIHTPFETKLLPFHTPFETKFLPFHTPKNCTWETEKWSPQQQQQQHTFLSLICRLRRRKKNFLLYLRSYRPTTGHEVIRGCCCCVYLWWGGTFENLSFTYYNTCLEESTGFAIFSKLLPGQ